MILIVVLMCTAIVAVVILQGSWLINSYAVSKEKNEAEIKVLLEQAITEQKRLTADTVRMLLKSMVHSQKDFNYRIFDNDWNESIKIGFRAKNDNGYALYNATAKDTVAVKKDPYKFLFKKMASLNLDELDPLSTVLTGFNQYDQNTRERTIQLKLSASFSPYKDTAALRQILAETFANEGRSFNGRIRFFKDVNKIYSPAVVKIKHDKKKYFHSSTESVSLYFDSERSKSLAVKLRLLAMYTDSLNGLGDSTFVAKPFFNNVNDIMQQQIPTILLSVDTPYTLIAQKMSAGIIGSFALMIFIMLCVLYMYKTIVKQKQLSDIKNDFISNISHELKTPIATAQAAVQGLKFFDPDQNPEKRDSYLSTASAEIQRLSQMADKILNISLFESAGFQLSPEYFDLKMMLKQIVESQQIRKEKPVKIALQYNAKPDIFADKTQLHDVMINLIDNAIKYSGSEVNIDINCTNFPGGIEISVSDDGNGIPTNFRKYVFDKFFRVPDANDHTIKGYGLGLNYVKTIVEKHKGSIQLGESGRSGTTFIINLPQPS